MSNEWFYIRRWREAAKPNWVIVERSSQQILKSGMLYYEAEEEAYRIQKENKNKVFVVNTQDPIYNQIITNQEEKNVNTKP